jgi:hypothetical protein
MSASKSFAQSIRDTFNDDFPTLTPLTEALSDKVVTPGSSSSSSSSSSSIFSKLQSVTWQTWLIIILILALLGINIFVYLAKGTQATASIFETVFGPILRFFGYSTLETTKQTVQTSATGTKAGVDVVANTTTGAINTIENDGQQKQQQQQGSPSSIPTGQTATSSQQGMPVQDQMQQGGANALNAANLEEYQQDALERALTNASQSVNVEPDNSTSAIQSSKVTGKAGWCYIGEDRGIRTCGEIGVNDVCMSGDIFPSQEICMNPNLRA